MPNSTPDGESSAALMARIRAIAFGPGAQSLVPSPEQLRAYALFRLHSDHVARRTREAAASGQVRVFQAVICADVEGIILIDAGADTHAQLRALLGDTAFEEALEEARGLGYLSE